MPSQSDDATIQMLEIVRENTQLLGSVCEDIGFLREAVDRQVPEQNYALTVKETLDCVKAIEALLATEAASRANDREAAAAAVVLRQKVEGTKPPGRVPKALQQQPRNGWFYEAIVFVAVLVPLLVWSSIPATILQIIPKKLAWGDKLIGQIFEIPASEVSERLMQRNDPKTWARMVAADKLLSANSEALAACRKAAGKSGKSKLCSVTIDPEPAGSR